MATYSQLCAASDPRYGAGTNVKIVSCPRKYKNYDLVGKIGIVRTNHVNNIAVAVEGLRNTASMCGYFYLEPINLIHIDENMEENTMSNISNYFNAVKIQFIDDVRPCGYIYANFDMSLKVNDLVVVRPAHHPIALARVVEILDGNNYETPREIVAKVDTKAYDERVKVRKQAAELKAMMQERAKKLQDIALYQMLAKDDSEMQDLLNRYQSLPQM